jgi:hypothetical protein
MSSGFYIANGEHSMNRKDNFQAHLKRDEAKKLKIKETKKKERKEKQECITYVTLLRQEKPSMTSWNQKDCSVFIQYKKQKGDPPLPRGISALCKRCEAISGDKSPDVSIHDSDDDDDDDITCEGEWERSIEWGDDWNNVVQQAEI